MSRRICVGNNRAIMANMCVSDSYGEGLVFVSAFGYTGNIKQVEKDINRKNTISMMGRYFTSEPKAYNVYTSKISNSEYSHIIISKKDRVFKDQSDREIISAYVLIDNPEFNEIDASTLALVETEYPQILQDKVFDKLYKLSPAPILKEWIPYLIRTMASTGRMRPLTSYTQVSDKHSLSAYFIHVEVETLISYISTGLRSGLISINNSLPEASSVMRDIAGIDGYLNSFSETLANRIRDAFRPQFIPGQDEYSQVLKDVCDYAAYHGHINLYDAQRAVVQATSNALNKKKAAFIIGEMGSGKTAMGIETVMTNMKGKRGQTVIVMCPGHIVRKWKAEIERLAPLSDAVIVEDFSSLLKLEKSIKNKNRKRNLWVILSKEVAKFGYEERPAAKWTESKTKQHGDKYNHGAYTCPCCGKVLHYITYVGKGKQRREVYNRLRERDFAKKNAKNAVCINKVRRWDPETMSWKMEQCGTKLWQAFTKDVEYGNGNGADEWVKTKAGWIQKAHIPKVLEKLNKDIETFGELEKEDSPWFEALTLEMDEEEKKIVRAPRKYPIARYIHRYLKGYIDYFIADEIHLLKGGDTAQGEAFGDITFAAKKTLALTGTLLNGYASGIYYILFRLFAGEMKKEGYDYDSPEEFAREYGVIKTECSYEWNGGEQGNRRGSTKTKFLPGVSPLVFTKFLLENAAFISQEDIASGLPGYKEIPVPVKMSPVLAYEYKEIERAFNNNKNPFNGGRRYLSQMVQLLSVYPDQPFDQMPVIDPPTGETIVTPRNLMRNDGELYPKEEAYVNLVKEKVAAGEKVLTYYHWTNRTNLGNRLKELLEAEGIKTTVMGATVKAKDRDAWIKDKLAKGTQVLICNPALVETGLDLLDFTTIIYYQVGYNLFTMRQASRRSWRLSQEHDVEVYFMYYADTVQEKALSLMATKLQASMAIEGKFSEEGLNAMSNNEDLLTQIASSVTEGIKESVDVQVFEQTAVKSRKSEAVHIGPTMAEQMKPYKHLNYRDIYMSSKKRNKKLLTVEDTTVQIQDNPFEMFAMA